MILNKLYTTPDNLFEPVTFVPGINYIFGKKETSGNSKESLNGIGKSTFLDLIDFALLSSYSKGNKKRLKTAQDKEILKGYSVVLEFTIDETNYAISRPFDNPSEILFSVDDAQYKEYPINNLKPYLCDLIFKQENYNGFYSNNWLRQLLPFFIKIQPPLEKVVFVNPIKYIPESSELILNQYHFFLLNIDNSLAHINYNLTEKYKLLKDSLKNTKDVLAEYFHIDDSPKLQNKIRELQSDIDSLSSSIETFEFNSKHKVDEREASTLTSQLSDLRFQNRSTQQKINFYEDSFKIDINVNTNAVKRIYSEFNELLGTNIKKALSDAINFKNSLIASRKDFIQEEIEKLKAELLERDKLIKQLDSKKAQLFKILEAKEAITDLSNSYYELSNKQGELNQLKSHEDLLFGLKKDEVSIKTELNNLDSKILDFKKLISKQEFDFSMYLRKIYNSLYPQIEDPLFFDISTETNTDAKFKFNILTNAKMYSRGRNQARTLIYDLSILFHAIDNNIKMPRFLIHDGIFDGMDKAHFISVVEYLEEQKSQGKNFQYILALNEEGDLKDNFGDADLVTTQKIEDEAILTLTPSKHLFETDFS